MANGGPIHTALQEFAAAITAKSTQLTAGEPEDQLRAPFENFIAVATKSLALNAVCTGETPLPDRLGRPDYAVHLNGLLAGYVELKAPGIGATSTRFKGHNREQFQRFAAIPNILYTDGNEWALYRNGELVDKVARLTGDVATQGKIAASPEDATAVDRVLRDFLSWEPIVPTDKHGKIDLKGFAALIAPLCRMLRDDVTDALRDPKSPLVTLAKDWRQLLFPDASDEQFADSYAQTVTFALLLGRSEGAHPLTLGTAESALAAQHSLLSRALQVLTDPAARAEMAASIDLLLRIVAVVPTSTLTGNGDPWLYFYEDFLAIYDPKLRKDAGVYYTPVEVVHAQVRLIDDLLVNHLSKPLGFGDPGVTTLDPATGTGTYLLGVIESALRRVELEQGIGAVAGQASALAANLYGFELMVGPYAVSELRISRALRDRGGHLTSDGTRVYLTDTLESPNASPPQLGFFLKPIADQHAKALNVKSAVPVIVCLGNPPYDRHEAATSGNRARTGGWVRWGDDGNIATSIFREFLEPTIAAGYGGDVKNLYNLYVYFWRWAMWKVFERTSPHGTKLEKKSPDGPGVVSFISASSYIEGDAFRGMREHMRRQCDLIWVIDLGGDGRGTRKDENIFAIQTPVAIAIAVRSSAYKVGKAARVQYSRINGTREAKLARLESIDTFEKVQWTDCPSEWQAPFRPAGKGAYFAWPLLTDLMPWQHSGIEFKRTWPIATNVETLGRRWHALLNAKDRGTMFRQTNDRLISRRYDLALTNDSSSEPIATLPNDSPLPPTRVFGFRSFDRHTIIADARLISRARPDLWRAHSDAQIYVTSLFNHPLGSGPALTACSEIPDRHHFRGSYGGKDVLPLYRLSDASQPNILPGMLALLGKTYDRKAPSPEEFLAYIYGAIAQPAFTKRFATELATRELRVPITKDAKLYEKVRDMGGRLLWLHTYGERCVPQGQKRGITPSGDAKCTKAVPIAPDLYPKSFEHDPVNQALRVGEGVFEPVPVDVFEFQVSGLKIVQSWLNYRMAGGAGRKSSPLDDVLPTTWTSAFTTELLSLLWLVEATIASYPEQSNLLDAIVLGACFQAEELPDVPDEMRSAPPQSHDDLFGVDVDVEG